MIRRILLLAVFLVLSVQVHADPIVYVSNNLVGSVSVIDIASHSVVTTIPNLPGARAMALSKTATRLYVCAAGGTIFVLDTASNEVIDEISTAFANNVIVDNNDRVLISRGNRQVAVIDPITHEIGPAAAVGEDPDEMTISSDGTTLYVVNTFDSSENNPCFANPTTCYLSVSTVKLSEMREVSRTRVGPRLSLIATHALSDHVFVLGTPKAQEEDGSNVALYWSGPLGNSWLQEPARSAWGLAPDPSRRALYLTSIPSEIHHYDIDKNAIVASHVVVPETLLRNAVVDPQGVFIYGLDDGSDALNVVDLRSFERVASVPVGRLPVDLVIKAGTAPPVPSPTATPTGACLGDCNHDEQVTVDELVLTIEIALGLQDVTTCSSIDGNGDGSITVDEIVQGVQKALAGC